ncbi:ATP synthase mitochondrial F1 complex assembly factor 2 homolog l(2)k14505 [Oratosquilla oratoria]|uniref:ATP synthase mitochondrial F1 complex assembly factor 2 homolog l(2)k14505 n=1 Tax=Oratosquilla oratoria TaxID=337810 RepID=UPI003F765C4D
MNSTISRVVKPLLFCTPALKVTKRFLPQALKRFYKNVTVAGSGGTYEVNLDHRKLKTPLGSVFQVPNYALALAISNEWASVQGNITPTWMHLTSLANTVIDNPNHETKWDTVGKTMEFLDTDTIMYRDDSSDDIIQVQNREWDPVMEWFNNRFEVNLKPGFGICGVEIPPEMQEPIRKYLLSYNIWAVNGFFYGVEALKSVVLTIAAAERKLSIEQAVNLSRLEIDYQTQRWGSVEWSHDLEMLDQQSKFAAAVLFIHLNSSERIVKHKMKL